MKTVLVVAGTSDAGDIIEGLAEPGVRVIATVATDHGKEILGRVPNVDILVGRIDAEGFKNLILSNGVSLVVDASHPYAEEVTRSVLRASCETGVSIIRYDRAGSDVSYGNTVYVDSYESAAKEAERVGGNILLTTGSNNLEPFIKAVGSERIFARVLPVSSVIRKCEALGLGPDNIIAVKGPFSAEMNISMMRHMDAGAIVTKDSGSAGATVEKIEAAEALGIKVIMIRRPKQQSERTVSFVGEAVAEAREALKHL
jgi:precorrin-6A/cobalt-precorrin-6A reductase